MKGGEALAVRLCTLILVLVGGWVGTAMASCVKQPPISLKGLDEWACRGMTYEQAWDTLAANEVAPVRSARVAELSLRTNYNSKKQKTIRGLQILGFATAMAGGFLGGRIPDWQVGLLIGGPKITEEGIKFFSAAPDDFVQLASDQSFATIYSLSSDKQIVQPPRQQSNVSIDWSALDHITDYATWIGVAKL